MEEYSGNSVVSVLLSETNYKAWSLHVKHYLQARNLWEVVAERKPKKRADQKFRLKVWKRKNAAALHAILISCSPSILPLIEDIKSARLAWATLANKSSQLNSVLELHEAVDSASLVEINSVSNISVDYLKYDPLFKAVFRGDWNNTKLFIDQNPEALGVRTPGLGKTALQLAVTEEHVHIVRKLMEIMTEQELEIVREDGYTALAAAIEVGNLSIAKCLVRKNRRLVSIIQQAYGIPVVHAVVTGQKHMAHYLYSATPYEDLVIPDERSSASSLLSLCISVQHFDIALHLLERAPFLAITYSPMWALANSKVFPSTSPLKFWQQWIYNFVHVPASATDYVPLDIENLADIQEFKKTRFTGIFIRCKEVLFAPLQWGWSYILDLLDIKGIGEMKMFHVQSFALLKKICNVIESTSDESRIRNSGIHSALISAVYAGNVEFISNIAKANPTLVWNTHIARRVFEVAVEHRQAKIFSLIYGLRNKTAIVSYRDENDSNMLHKAAAVPKPNVLNRIPGAALQMQKELQWFKELDKLATQPARELTNKEYLTPSALFTEEHKDLVVEGEKWMKGTANSSSFVGALIVTITFAAAFTFPGGYNQNDGFPMFLDKKLYKVFMMSNAIALFSSTTSVLTFLGILTSHYGEEDFLVSLPRKLIIGLSTLFLSIATLIVTFCAGFSIMFQNRLWLIVPTICLACIPILFYVALQFPLLVYIFKSTYGISIFDRNVKRWLYV